MYIINSNNLISPINIYGAYASIEYCLCNIQVSYNQATNSNGHNTYEWIAKILSKIVYYEGHFSDL